MSGLALDGTLVLETRRSGIITARRKVHNIVTQAGLYDLAQSFAWAGVTDLGAAVNASFYSLAPLYGAVGNGVNPIGSTTGSTSSTSNPTIITSITPPAWAATGMVVQGSGVPAGATITAIGGSSITISLPCTLTASGVTLYIGTSTSDTQLYAEVARSTVSAATANPGSGNGPSTIWQFQYGIQSTTYAITEVGLFSIGSSVVNSGNMFDHAIVGPSLSWTAGETLTMSASIMLVTS